MVFGNSLLLQILLYAGLSFGTFEIYLNTNDLNCRKTGVQCINDTSFTTCTGFENLTVLANTILHCPDGYFCNDASNYPCRNESTTTSTTESTTTEEITNSTPSDSSTTKKTIVPRPTAAPNCTTTGLWAAPACSQYYECVEKSSWVFWKYFEAELRTCIAGYYYDTGLKKCIEASLSDCKE